MSKIVKQFRSRLTALRGERTQAQFASDLGTSQQNVSRWERGEMLPGFDQLLQIGKREKINLNWLVLGEGEPRA